MQREVVRNTCGLPFPCVRDKDNRNTLRTRYSNNLPTRYAAFSFSQLAHFAIRSLDKNFSTSSIPYQKIPQISISFVKYVTN